MKMNMETNNGNEYQSVTAIIFTKIFYNVWRRLSIELPAKIKSREKCYTTFLIVHYLVTFVQKKVLICSTSYAKIISLLLCRATALK